MNKITFVSLFFAIPWMLCGCSRSNIIDIPNGHSLTVVPGTGIVNFVEMGMQGSTLPSDLKTVKHKNTFKSGGRKMTILTYQVDEWGLEFNITDDNPIGLLQFYTVPIRPAQLASRNTTNFKPFRGKVSSWGGIGGVSFFYGPVNRDMILQQFGSVEQVATNSYGFVENPFLPFVLMRPEDVEVINYPNGIEFWLKSNIVECFYIFPPASERVGKEIMNPSLPKK